MIYTKPQLVLLAEAAALKHGLDPALVCSIINLRSGWFPGKMEWLAGQTVYGLFQLPLESGLPEPEEQVETGCKKIKELLASSNGRPETMLMQFSGVVNSNFGLRVLTDVPMWQKFLKEKPNASLNSSQQA
jgi:hypothetical protein